MSEKTSAKVYHEPAAVALTPTPPSDWHIQRIEPDHMWSEMGAIGIMSLPSGGHVVADAQTGAVFVEAMKLGDLLPWLTEYAEILDREGGVWVPGPPDLEDGSDGRVEVLGTLVAWQTDVHGQQENDKFLASFADYIKVPTGSANPFKTWLALIEDYYRDTDGDLYLIPATDTLEAALDEFGYYVDWDNGVYIFKRDVKIDEADDPALGAR